MFIQVASSWSVGNLFYVCRIRECSQSILFHSFRQRFLALVHVISFPETGIPHGRARARCACKFLNLVMFLASFFYFLRLRLLFLFPFVVVAEIPFRSYKQNAFNKAKNSFHHEYNINLK